MRLFVAADLPEAAVQRLAAHGRALSAAGGWRALEPAAIHVTLVFLGEHPPEVVKPIAAELEAAWRPVGGLRLGAELRLPPRRPRVAAIGVEDPGGELTRLQGEISARLAGLGVHTPERRRFLAHATVARRSRGAEGRVAWLVPAGDELAVSFLALYASQLSPAGARYDALARFPR
jgi:2'-5' RNA ligase